MFMITVLSQRMCEVMQPCAHVCVLHAATWRLLTNHGPRAFDMNSLMHVFRKLKDASADHLPQLSILRPMNTVSSPGPTCMYGMWNAPRQ